MKTQPIVAACIQFEDGQPPRAPDFGDVYHPRIGADIQARHVFLAGNGLPGRWAGVECFVVLETGFGLGHNFLCTWQTWQADPARCHRLVFVSLDKHPPTQGDLARAHAGSSQAPRATQLLQAWPPLTANLHVLEFEAGQVQLILGWGDIARLLPQIDARVHAFYLDGFAPARNPQMWERRVIKALARLAQPGATAATWSVARGLRDDLTSAGFDVSLAPGVGGKREMTRAVFRPPWRLTGRAEPPAPGAERQAVVLGAGLAGAWVAHSLASAGWQVQVIERHLAPAEEASGNPAGMFHGTAHADDGVHARLFRAAALLAHRKLAPLIEGGLVSGQLRGLLRIEAQTDALARMHSLVEQQALPSDYVRVLDAAQAGALAGVALGLPAWFYAQGGWIDPAALVHRLLDRPGVRFFGGQSVQALRREGDLWALRDAHGATLARTPVLVLANGDGASGLLAGLGHAAWPFKRVRGQVSAWAGSARMNALQLPVAGNGYALPLPDGGLLCGATSDDDDACAEVRLLDHQRNFDKLLRLTGLQPPEDRTAWSGRVGWRVYTPDKLPVVGPLPLPPGELPGDARLDQARWVPRSPGLYAACGLGARGITLAPLAGALLSAQITGSPWPLERDLAEAIDPARWLVRAARHGS